VLVEEVDVEEVDVDVVLVDVVVVNVVVREVEVEVIVVVVEVDEDVDVVVVDEEVLVLVVVIGSRRILLTPSSCNKYPPSSLSNVPAILKYCGCYLIHNLPITSITLYGYGFII